MSKYGVISGPYFPVLGMNTEIYCPNTGDFSPNTGKYGPEITPYLETFHAVRPGSECTSEPVKKSSP